MAPCFSLSREKPSFRLPLLVKRNLEDSLVLVRRKNQTLKLVSSCSCEIARFVNHAIELFAGSFKEVKETRRCTLNVEI